MRVDIERSVLGLQIGKFYPIFTDIWPLIYVQDCVMLYFFFLTNGWILIRFCVITYINKIKAWIVTFHFW